VPEIILSIIDGLIKLAIVGLEGVPPDVRVKRELEIQADIDWWRTVLHLYVPNLPPPPVKA
jgi:hypothetical protein